MGVTINLEKMVGFPWGFHQGIRDKPWENADFSPFKPSRGGNLLGNMKTSRGCHGI